MVEMYGRIIDSLPALLDSLFTLEMLVAMTVGILGGMLIGALPGLNGIIGITLLMPLTYNMSPIPALAMLMTIYTTSVLGGSFTAILVSTPGTGSNAATVLEGYKMTRNGQAGRALNMSLFASTIGGVISGLMLLFLAPPIAELSLAIDSAESFVLGLLGISIIASLAADNLAKGFVMGCMGMLLSTVGITPIVGDLRFTFGSVDLNDGFRSTVIILGIFSIAQVIGIADDLIAGKPFLENTEIAKVERGFLSKADIKLCMPHIIKSSFIGTYVGILPGAGANIASFMAYNQAKKDAKHPEEFDHGSIEGLAAPEAANNAVTGASMIPLMTLGIPGSATAAVLLGALMIHGLIPGASLFTTQSNITYPIIILFLLANLIMFPVGIVFARYIKNVVKIDPAILNTVIATLVILGAFAVANRSFDLFVVVAFGVLGYLAKKTKFSQPAFVLGTLLGGLTEKGFIRSSTIADALGISLLEYFVSRPMTVVLAAITLIGIFGPLVSKLRKKKSAL